MDIKARKYKLIERVMQLNESQIDKLEGFIDEVSSSKVSESLEQALEQVKAGKVTPHPEVKKKYNKWL